MVGGESEKTLLLFFKQKFICEVDIPYLIICLNWTSIFEWIMVGCGSNIKYPKYMCLNEIGLHTKKYR